MILAVRHPKPAIDPGICYGRLDVPLAMPPAQAAASVLQRHSLADCRVIVSSPLQRARLLAFEIARMMQLEVVIEPRIAEMDFGDWENAAWSAIPRIDIDAWAADPLGYRPGGGETVHELQERVLGALRDRSQESALWVTHAGPMRCLYAHVSRAPLADCLNHPIAYGEVLEIPAGRNA